jgi:enediyne biosynthesis protein E5
MTTATLVSLSSPPPVRTTAYTRPSFDPRLYQIAILAALLAYGVTVLAFDIRAPQVVVILGTALAVQYAGGRWAGLPRFDVQSALISALSLCLLLRTSSLGLAAAAAGIAIGSKFVVRVGGKHVFNPTNIALVALIGTTGGVWVSPGQWGSAAFFAFLMACLGGLVVNRAARSDVTYAFLFFHLAIVFGRSLGLGEPMAIPLHRVQSGALLLFAFFMISDPKTTPDSRTGRILFAALVALGGGYVQFKLFRTNGLLHSLAVVALLVPLIDRLFPGPRYQWAAGPPRRD